MAEPLDRDAVAEQLQRVLRSTTFRRSDRSSSLLRFVVERALDGSVDQLKEYTLGVEALGRPESFDPRVDPIVRAEASRLRDRLARYYATEGSGDPVVIVLPKGSYVPRFTHNALPDPPPVLGDTAADREVRAPVATVRPSRGWIAWLAGAAALVAAVVASVTWPRLRAAPAASAPPARFEVELGAEAVLGSEVGSDVALSSDGTRIVFVARDSGGRANLFTRRLDQPAVARLVGTEGARVPFLSPDGRWVGFWADAKLKRVPVDGGAPVVLCDATDVLGASWGEDGQIVAAINPTGKLWRIPGTGGPPRVLFDLTADSATPQWPQVLPGGRAVIYAAQRGGGADQATIEARELPNGERKVVVRGGTFPRYLPNGYLTYVNQGTLYAVPFDAARLAATGAAVPVLEDVAYSRTFGFAQLDIARTGMLVYRRSPGGGKVIVARVGRNGEVEPIVERPGYYNWPRSSPNGGRAAFTGLESGAASVRVVERGTAAPRRVSGVSREHAGLTWWADGRTLIVGGRGGMRWVNTDGPDAPQPLSTSRTVQVPWSLAPGLRRIAYYEFDPATAFDLWTASVSATSGRLTMERPEPFLRTSAFEVYPAFSPDGRWIAYSSNESGTYEIYVRPFPDSGPAVRVTTSGGRVVTWSPTKQELVYQTDDHQLMVSAYRVQGGRFVPSAPTRWARTVLADAGVLPSFDIAADGEHVVALLPAAPDGPRQSPNHVTVVLNFHEQVRRRVQDTPSPSLAR